MLLCATGATQDAKGWQMKKRIPNPNNQRQGAPLWPIAGVPIVGKDGEVYHLNLYPDYQLMNEHDGKGRPISMELVHKLLKAHFYSKGGK